MKGKIRILWIILIFGALLLSGCQTAKKPVTPPKTNPTQVTESDKRLMANGFSKVAQGVAGVTKATVVIASADASTGVTSSKGKMVVLVGLTLNASTNASAAKQKAVRDTVRKRILASDKRVTDVLVTSDPNMVKKINDVAAGLIEGKPVLTYAKSAAELGKMMKTQMK